MKKFLFFATLCLAVMGLRGAEPEKFTVVLRGTVEGRSPKDSILVLRRNLAGHGETMFAIEVKEGRFLDSLETTQHEAWTVSFGLGRDFYSQTCFFAEPGEVEFTLHGRKKWLQNTVRGGAMNTEYAAVKDSMRVWTNERKEQYLLENPTPVSYDLLFTESMHGRYGGRLAEWLAVYEKAGYARKYPDSKFTKLMDDLATFHKQFGSQGRYIDFELPDLDGNMVRVSEQIEGKMAIIDIWMSWCAPCRKGLRELIPVYERYKDKGLVVISASGDRTADIARNSSTKDGHPWPTLIDEGGRAGLFSKYGLTRTGGMRYLVDGDGKILIVSPSAKALRQILKEKFGE